MRARWATLRLVGSALALATLGILSGCAGGTAPGVEGEGAPPATSAAEGVGALATAGAGGKVAQAIIASTDLATGRQRFAFALLDADGGLIQDAEAELTLFHIDGEVATAVAQQMATFYPSRLEPAGVYVAYHDFDRPGVWGASIDTGEGEPLRVRFTVAEKSAGPAVGEDPPPLANRTSATEPEMARLTSDPHPDPELYRMTVDEARASGKPSVVVFATPGFCQSKICGPVLDEIKALKADWGDRFNFIHIEVYGSFDPLELDPAMAAWGLQTEPWVFVLDANGRVAERLEGSATAAEVEPILERLAGESPGGGSA